jgi:hypothetical protein
MVERAMSTADFFTFTIFIAASKAGEKKANYKNAQ